MTGRVRRSLAVVAMVALFAASACGGGKAPAVPPELTGAKAERDISQDGAALLSTTITVQFDRSYELAPAKVPLASFFELHLPAAGNTASRVFVQAAEFPDKDDRRVVKLAVRRLIPQGSKLKIAKAAFAAGAQGDLTIEVESSLTPTAVLLASTALAIPGPELLDDPVVTPATPGDHDPAIQRTALEDHLDRRGVSPDVHAAAIARYEAIPGDVVPSAKLRAALAALTGTFAEPALDSLFTDKNCTGKPVARIAFQPPPDLPELIARLTFDGERRVISINPQLEGDRIEHLMPFLAHETIHCDRDDSRAEEVAATGFDTFLYTQLIAADPTLVNARSKATRELNLDTVAFINSGRRVPESVGILPSTGVTRAIPNTNSTFGSFAEMIVAAYPDIQAATSPPEPVAEAYAANLAKLAGMPARSPFDLKYLDELVGRAMDPEILARAIRALGLVPLPG